jgi:hypothetical protein
MSVFAKFDKAFDIKALKEDVAAAAEGNQERREVPEGTYEVKVEKMGLKVSKSEKPMTSIWFRVLTGDYKNSIIFYNQVLSSGFGVHNSNLFLSSLLDGEEVKFDGFEKYDKLITGIFNKIDGKFEYALEYGKNDKGYNTYKITEVFEA